MPENQSMDRRFRRSDDPDVATRLQLEQVVEDFGLETCILVDEAGRLVSHADDSLREFHDELARATPRLASGSRCRQLFSRLNRYRAIRPNQISACEFRANGQRYFVTTVGAMPTMRDVGMYRAILGIRRIRSAA